MNITMNTGATVPAGHVEVHMHPSEGEPPTMSGDDVLRVLAGGTCGLLQTLSEPADMSLYEIADAYVAELARFVDDARRGGNGPVDVTDLDRAFGVEAIGGRSHGTDD